LAENRRGGFASLGTTTMSGLFVPVIEWSGVPEVTLNRYRHSRQSNCVRRVDSRRTSSLEHRGSVLRPASGGGLEPSPTRGFRAELVQQTWQRPVVHDYNPPDTASTPESGAARQ